MNGMAMDPALALEVAEVARHRVINETIARGDSPVQQFYAGAVVFITGGSGFLGKQLIEKIFRSCKIKKIYILLRFKKEQDLQKRKEKILKDPVYEFLSQSQPDYVDKLVPVLGDVSQVRLGISDGDWNMITEEIDIIFHSAATINFTDPLKKAVLTNVRGTVEVIKLAKACKNLRSYVHISTAYSHATPEKNHKDVLEDFYDPPVKPDALLTLVDTYDETALDAMTPELIKPWPNTYSFTKAVAEEAIRNMAKDLPVCVVRPAIVISALREPAPGWIDRSCVFGPSGFMVGVGLGVMHVLYANLECNLDLVPVDLTNNAVLAAAYHTGVRRERGETDVKVYTVTGTKNPLKFENLNDFMYARARSLASNYQVYHGFAFVVKNRIIFYLLSLIYHLIPAFLIDCVLFLMGKKPMAVKIYRKLITLNEVLGYYMTREWQFQDSNLQKLYCNLTEADRIIYNCNMHDLHWELYLKLWIIGCRKYILRDGLKDTDKAVRKGLWLKYLHYVVGAAYYYGLYCVLYYIVGAMYFVLIKSCSLLVCN